MDVKVSCKICVSDVKNCCCVITYLLPSSPFDNELVLKHNQVPLARCKTYELFQSRTERVEKISSDDRGRLRGENAHPLQASNDALTLRFSRESGDFLDAGYEGAMNEE